VSITSRLDKLERRSEGLTAASKERRVMELLAIGSARRRGQEIGGVSALSEGEMLSIIGATKEDYERALRGFVATRRGAAYEHQ
jgi:hypothetical protein